MRDCLGNFLLFIVFVQLPLGLSIAGTVRVGNELGAGQPQKAKRAAYVCIFVTCKREEVQDTNIVQYLHNTIGHNYCCHVFVT